MNYQMNKLAAELYRQLCAQEGWMTKQQCEVVIAATPPLSLKISLLTTDRLYRIRGEKPLLNSIQKKVLLKMY